MLSLVEPFGLPPQLVSVATLRRAGAFTIEARASQSAIITAGAFTLTIEIAVLAVSQPSEFVVNFYTV
jgi:hypothetical protein